MQLIKVQPARALRVDFARWAVAQTPKVRTSSPLEFAVPAALFPAVPGELLAGALVDGQPYVPAAGEEPAHLLGVSAPPETASAAGESPASAREHEEQPRPRDAEQAGPPALEQEEQADLTRDEAVSGEYTCPDCGRPFPTPRGLSAHRRQAHLEED
jgi:hypothetical protein